jgi:hypothetical protein
LYVKKLFYFRGSSSMIVTMSAQRNDTPWSATQTVVGAVLAKIASPARWRQYAVWKVWDEVVGPAVARKAKPSRIQNGKLFVTVSNSAYMQELQFSKMLIRQKLNQKLGEGAVSDIFFVIGRVGEQVTHEPTPPKLPLPQFTELSVPHVQRPELAAALQKLLEARRRRLTSKERPDERIP